MSIDVVLSIGCDVGIGVVVPANVSLEWTTFCTELGAYDYTTDQVTFTKNVVNPADRTLVKLPIYTTLLDNAELSPVLAESAPSLLVLGHPGTGKSSCAVFIMKRAMMSNIPFMFSMHGCDYVYCWTNGIATVCTLANNPVHEDNRIWIMNQKEHGRFMIATCRTVLICSPKRDNCHSYKKYKSGSLITAYVRTPTLEEVIMVATLSGIAVAETRRRVAICGPVFRPVCSKMFSCIENEIEDALQHCSFDVSIFNSTVVGESESAFDLSHRLFLSNAGNDFLPLPKTFVSDLVRDRFMQAWKEKNIRNFRSFIASNNNTNMGVEYGLAFEVYAHELLVRGGTFVFRLLHGKNHIIPVRLSRRTTIQLPLLNVTKVANTVNFTSLLAQQLFNYLQPLSGNFGAVDSIVLRCRIERTVCTLLYQITCNG